MANFIVALATPPLRSALALIRLSGEGVFEATDTLFSKKVSGVGKRESFVGVLKDKDSLLDQVVLLAYPALHSPTGEDSVEIICHGSPLIADEIISAYIRQGGRLATRGEFTCRSFYNGKMDLIEAESVNDLINATNTESKNLSLMAALGKTSSLVLPLKTSLADLLSLIEVNIDYPEYTDIEEANEKKIVESIDTILIELTTLIRKAEEGKIVKDGLKVALAGEPNVGKSSLLNAFLQKDKAIVSDIPGTTRDVVEGEVSIRGLHFIFLDTAGIRQGAGSIEEMGIKKSEESIKEADIVLLVSDARTKEGLEDQRIKELAKDKILIEVHNKSDLISNEKRSGLYVSALRKDIDPLIDEIFSSIGLSPEAFREPSLCNAREIGLLKQIHGFLLEARCDASNALPIDLVSVNLMSAYNACRELLGEGATNDLTDEVFSRFCVGK